MTMSDLLEAIFKCDLRKLKTFVDNGRNVNYKIPETEGCTILHIVAGTEKDANNKEEILSYLLEMGADPNVRSYDDLTPVHIAATWNNFYELDKLLQYGGNPWLLDNESKNAFDLAADNNAYEAYQLLNKYLANGKLNFRSGISKSNSKSKHFNKDESKDKSENCVTSDSFYSANEEFPLIFSSTDDESASFLINVSKIIKKNNYKKQNMEEGGTKNYMLINSRSWSWKPNMLNKSILNRATIFPPDREISSGYLNNDNSSCETIVESDNASGIVLVEQPSTSIFQNSFPNPKFATSQNLVNSDWKSCRSDSIISSSDCFSDGSSEVIVPEEFHKFSDSKIFQELRSLGDNPGPINEFTRKVYLERLAKLKNGSQVPGTLQEPKYCHEMYLFLNEKLCLSEIQVWVDNMAAEFNNSMTRTEWREGNQKSSFNYFLLDPRVTQNLPVRHRTERLTFEQTFQIFVDSIFYVGKGSKGRPYSHLLDAAKAMTAFMLKSYKINHILDIWNTGYGVISLHCFHNCIPVEAYTQEACIIESIGLKNLTNQKAGDYYGQATRWMRSWKRKVGISLLNRALQIFLFEGEKQIKPKDLKRK